ncbi:hypothetical protein CF651_31160 [Paenibacillus rigui]|uniref:Uncharacterized protein n=1 Tax=Paenibacillus rigui TaxID=554312 RepID=A0A229UG96_9BACL|nr:hypothetical protein CF651_31160 [Paenibacillus rigui]
MFLKYREVCLAALLILFMLFSGKSTIYAMEKVPPPFQTWSNGAKLSVESSTDTGETTVNVSTKDLDKGTYGVYLYDTELEDWSSYGALSFHVDNQSDAPLRLNVIVTLADGISLTVVDKGNAIVQSKDDTKRELVGLTLGSIWLKAHFQGIVSVPFSSLGLQNAAGMQEKPEIAAIASWGITANMDEGMEQRFLLGGYQLIPKEDAAISNQVAGAVLTGELQALKPYIGESIVQYGLSIRDTQLPVTFKLASPMDGASISQDGRLALTPSVQADKITIDVDIGSEWTKSFNVELFPSWSLHAKQADGTSLTIPTNDEMSRVVKDSDPFVTPRALTIARTAIAVIVAGIGLLYIKWRRRR